MINLKLLLTDLETLERLLLEKEPNEFQIKGLVGNLIGRARYWVDVQDQEDAKLIKQTLTEEWGD